jgi:hypothetical protein
MRRGRALAAGWYPVEISMRGAIRLREAALALACVLWLAWLLCLGPRPSEWLVVATGLPLLAAGSVLASRRAGEPWAAFVRRTAHLHALALVLLYALGVQWADAHGITTDGVTYFAQLRSLIFDGDLAIAEEYKFLGQPARPGYFVPVGPTLLWLPLYLAVAAVDGAGRALGVWAAPADPIALGLTLPYVRAALVSSFAVGAAGLFAMLVRLGREFPRSVALIATVLLFGATPLFWYMVYEPSMTHAASFGIVALFVIAAVSWAPNGLTPRRSMILGALSAWAFLIRPQEALFVLVPAALILASPGTLASRARAGLTLLMWAALAALPWLVLQVIHAWVLHRSNEFALIGSQGAYLDPFRSRWMETLFSSRHGFLSWSPIAYVAVIGTIAYAARSRVWAIVALGILFLMAWVNGSTLDWSGGWSFGGRRFTSTLVLLAPGLALVIDVLRRRPLVAIAPLAVAALWWNYLLMVQYTVGALPKDEPFYFGRMVRQQAEVRTRPPYTYPFAFPANVLFSWRTGLPPDRYDVLGGEPLQSQLDLAFDARVERYLLDGWDAPGGDDWGSCWWIGGTPAVVIVPLDLPAGRDVEIEIQARTRFEEPAVAARLALEVNGHDIGSLTAGATEPTTTRFTVPAGRVQTIWKAGYNRIALHSTGVTRIDPADTRPPGPLGRRSDRRPWPVAIYSLRITPR